MYKGSITDIEGVTAGHYTDAEAKTGCTVVLCEKGAVCGVDVRGGAPGTRETDLARPGNLVKKAHAVLLSGGSAYGLDAAAGVMQYLEEKDIGFNTGYAKVPIVPAAVIYDLGVGKADIRPGKQAGYYACLEASAPGLQQGAFGAGTGATVGKLLGLAHACSGGVGTASIELKDGVIVAALFVVNAFGDVVDPHTGKTVAGMKNPDGSYPGTCEVLLSGIENKAAAGQNTTIGVVATNAALTKEEANKMAAIAHDGIALCVRPAHTMLDGDTVFALSAGEKQADFNVLLAAAVEAVCRAIVNACSRGE